jgi:hypothetical protein
MRVTILMGAAILAGSVAVPAASRDRKPPETVESALAGFQPGTPASCLPTSRNINSRRLGERTILFRVGAREIWRNDMPAQCGGIDKRAAMVTQTPSGRLCRGDIVTFVDLQTGFSAGACPLGDFVPYRKPGK